MNRGFFNILFLKTKSVVNRYNGFVWAITTVALCCTPLTLLLSEDAFAVSPRLVFSDSTQVISPRIYLEDIATVIQGSSLFKEKVKGITIAASPTPGREKIIRENHILRALDKEDINHSNTELVIPEEIRVSRKSITYGKLEIEELIRAELLKKNFIDKKSTLFNIDEIQKDVLLPVSDTITVVKLPGTLRAVNMFWVSFYSNGKRKERIWAKGTIKRFADVLAVNRNISANSMIGENDLIYVNKNILDLEGDYFTNKRAVAGKAARHNLTEGSIIRKTGIDDVVAVRAGDLVTILAKMKSLTISAQGKILSPKGDIGETITVLNVDSNEKLQAVVLDKSTVKVEVY